MTRVHFRRALWAGPLACLLAVTGARAEDERGRWSFSFGLGVHSTFDDIRNNAGVVFTCDQDDQNCNGFLDNTESTTGGVTTGTPVGEVDLSDDVVKVSDPRQDDLMARQTKVEEKQRIDFSAAYGLTSWLSLQIETGLYRGDVAPLDVHHSIERWAIPPQSAPDIFELVTEQVSQPITLGELTQIPLTFNAVVRFRKDSPFNPFLGIGVGYMFNDLDESEAFKTLNSQILRGFNRVMGSEPDDSIDGALNVQQIYTGFSTPDNTPPELAEILTTLLYNVDCTTGERVLYTNICTSIDPDTRRVALLPTRPFIEAEVSDGFMYQFSVGADYHFNEKWSTYVAARYQVTDAKISVKTRGTDPVGGSFECTVCTFRFLSENNPFDPLVVPREGLFHRTGVDGGNPTVARQQTLYDRLLVQGGEIDLSTFTVGAGIRFTF